MVNSLGMNLLNMFNYFQSNLKTRPSIYRRFIEKEGVTDFE